MFTGAVWGRIRADVNLCVISVTGLCDTRTMMSMQSKVARYGTLAAVLALAFVPAMSGTGAFLPHTFCYLRQPSLV
jgi:ribose/xylose/arabinose/galactoside ABC-type transport system permease subunit